MKRFLLFLLGVVPLFGQPIMFQDTTVIIESEELQWKVRHIDTMDMILLAVYDVSFGQGMFYQIRGDSLKTMLREQYPYDIKVSSYFITTICRLGATDGWWYAKTTNADSVKYDKKLVVSLFVDHLNY